MKSASQLSSMWGFFVSLVATGVILMSVPYDESKLGYYRMDSLLQRETSLHDVLTNQCGRIASGTPASPSADEKMFLERYTPGPTAKTDGNGCTVTIVNSSRDRFGIRTYWHYLVTIRNARGTVFERKFAVEAPRPLVLLPLAAILLALIFEIPWWGMTWTLSTYLFTLAGLNLIDGLRMAVSTARLTVETDQTLPGFLLIAAWLTLLLAHRERLVPRIPKNWADRVGTRFANMLIGLWNPGVYTIAGQLLFPVKRSLARALPFLDTQLVLLGLSLYLFSLDIHQFGEFLKTGVLLPRYFTYTVFLFVAVSNWSLRPRRQVLLWKRPGIWRALVALLVVEAAGFRLPWLRMIPTATRFGAALLASELVYPIHIDWGRALRLFLPWAAVIGLASFVTALSLNAGSIDLMLVMTEPRIHPVGIVFFTFLAGIALGFISGGFSSAFFALFTLMVKTSGQPLVRAALLDGVFAGMLLSPFSIYNLMPAVQFGIAQQEILKFRFKQLAYPLVIGAIIYAVSAVNSVAILRPATFVFLCLAALAFQLRKSYWQIGQHTFSLEKAPR